MEQESPSTHQCPLCGSQQQRLVTSRSGYDIFACGQCRLEYVFPLLKPDEVLDYYDTEKSRRYRELAGVRPSRVDEPRDGEQDAYRPQGGRFRMWDRCRVARWILKKTKGGRLLDVGCSQGDLVAAADEVPQFEAVGLDLNRPALGYAESRGLSVKHGYLEHPPFEPESFDVVVLWHTLEHVGDPKAALTAVHNVLRPGGWFVCCAPSPAHPKARLVGRNWHHYCPPVHLWFFSEPNMRLLCEQCGLNLVETSLFHYHADMTALARKA